MVEMERQGKKDVQLVLIPCPFQGHINPMLQLGTILYSKGFSVTIAHTEFQFPDTSKHPDFMFLRIPNGSWDQPVSSSNFAAFLSCLNINCKAPLQESLTRKIEEKIGHEDVHLCIIYDGLMYFADEVAFELKLPSIILRTSSATNLLTYLAYPHKLKEGHFPLEEANALDLVPGLQPLRFKDLPVYKFHLNVDILIEVIGATLNLRSSKAIIWNTMDFMEQPSLAQLQLQYKVPVFAIGPMHKLAPTSSGSLLHEDASCITWLDMQANNSVIYISLGSIASMNEKELVEMAWGLANSKQPFLWVIRSDSSCNSDKPEILPEDYKEIVRQRGSINM
ncbi:putative UDP-glucuronosyltransferase [Tripterygium wilfordii]|uniref:Putative UDP-glucuronosyltransferase n=1 Tax=Tripterygium wilfordii TaxID=458696 RepID=A0A7J7DE34_TRIWF|nr:UDP-glucose iridoid glucosyltransferase-like [Tripterygium wilfordii]KAF5744554.1 putative UDP-glucuronosyltransferase [Tripterygium wilfordii]